MNDDHGFIRLHGLYKGFQEGGRKRSVLLTSLDERRRTLFRRQNIGFISNEAAAYADRILILRDGKPVNGTKDA